MLNLQGFVIYFGLFVAFYFSKLLFVSSLCFFSIARSINPRSHFISAGSTPEPVPYNDHSDTRYCPLRPEQPPVYHDLDMLRLSLEQCHVLFCCRIIQWRNICKKVTENNFFRKYRLMWRAYLGKFMSEFDPKMWINLK